ncbi:hypothetical protein [Actinoplanes sp. NPDC049118]|uniref:hypothetical protein n=1 Tax=Actinoplanes sp. NPDC049118 TaxID=3155769 RepID=UPI00340C78FD
MTASPARLERRYRRLLLAYPGPYRRRHGAEIVTTLLDLAEPGRGRPAAAQALHLVACGLRQRFRLPAGRPLALVAAVLAAVAVGALGAAAGNRLGWRTATPVPSADVLRALAADAAGGSRSDVAAYPWETAMNGPVLDTRVTVASAYSAERVRNALAAAGWRTTTLRETTGGIVVDITEDPYVTVPTRSVRFEATKDGLSLTGDSTTVAADARRGVEGRTDQLLGVSADESAAVRPLTVAGLLLGAVAGWLVAAAFAYRLRRGGRSRRRVAAALVAAAFAAAAVPVFVLYGDLQQVLAYDSGAPGPYIVDGPGGRLPAGLAPACAVAGLLALAAALVIARRGARDDTGATGPAPAASG